MKYAYSILLMMLCGCATVAKKANVQPELFSAGGQSIIQPQFPILGNLACPPMTDCRLQESYNLHEWYDAPDEEITVLPDGSWLIDPRIPHVNLGGDIHRFGQMFYRVIGTSI